MVPRGRPGANHDRRGEPAGWQLHRDPGGRARGRRGREVGAMTVEPRDVMGGLEAFSLQGWIAKNRHRMIPPIANETIFKGNDTFIVMVSSGPNSRKDYHYNESEELFLQLEGDIEIGLVVDGEHRAETVREGELFLIPPKVP